MRKRERGIISQVCAGNASQEVGERRKMKRQQQEEKKKNAKQTQVLDFATDTDTDAAPHAR